MSHALLKMLGVLALFAKRRMKLVHMNGGHGSHGSRRQGHRTVTLLFLLVVAGDEVSLQDLEGRLVDFSVRMCLR